MNCKDTRELISLYIGLDLEPDETHGVAQHLLTCTECSRLEADYRETIRMIEHFGPPEFSDSVYLRIRRGVIEDIGRQAAWPRLADWIAGLFLSYARLASASVVLLTVALAAFYFVAIYERSARQIDGEDGPVSENLRANADSDPSDTFPDVAPPSVRPKVIAIKGPPRSIHRSSRRQHAGMTARMPKSNTRKRRHDLAADHLAVSHARPDLPLRVEMQTGDPNIRIIWFANVPSKPPARN